MGKSHVSDYFDSSTGDCIPARLVPGEMVLIDQSHVAHATLAKRKGRRRTRRPRPDNSNAEMIFGHRWQLGLRGLLQDSPGLSLFAAPLEMHISPRRVTLI